MLFSLIELPLIIGCNSNEYVEYYEDGNMKRITTILNDSCKKVTTYYNSQRLKEEGKICKNQKDGEWFEFYEDGDLKWHGNYKQGTRILPELNSSIPCELYFKGNPDTLVTGQSYLFRFTYESLHPESFRLVALNAVIKYASTDTNNFTYKIMPTAPGEVHIIPYYRLPNGEQIEVCDMNVPAKASRFITRNR